TRHPRRPGRDADARHQMPSRQAAAPEARLVAAHAGKDRLDSAARTAGPGSGLIGICRIDLPMDLSFTPDEEAFAREVRAWLVEHVEVPPRFETIADEVDFGRRWQSQLAEGRWVGIHWPREYGGRGASPVQVAIFNMEYARSRALQPINRVGINLAGPTLLAHGREEQKQQWLPAILTAEEIWCQLFSEPNAGSDLASLQTKAIRA